MLQKKINQKLNNTLLFCDILQKYNFLEKETIPNIKQITLKINYSDFNGAYENKMTEENKQQAATYFVYFISSFFPNITTLKSDNEKNNLILQVTLKNKIEISSFIDNFFLDLLDTQINNKIVFSKTDSELVCILPYNKKTDFSNVISNINLTFRISFLFNKNNLQKQQLFKKYPHFWVFL